MSWSLMNRVAVSAEVLFQRRLVVTFVALEVGLVFHNREIFFRLVNHGHILVVAIVFPSIAMLVLNVFQHNLFVICPQIALHADKVPHHAVPEAHHTRLLVGELRVNFQTLFRRRAKPTFVAFQVLRLHSTICHDS